MNWLKKFIVKVILENITVTVDKKGKPQLEWKVKKEF